MNLPQKIRSLFLLPLLVPVACGGAPAQAPAPPPSAAPPPASAPAAAAPAAPAKPAPRADATLAPRSVLFGNPDRASPRVSPDGKRLGFLAPSGGVLNVWVGPVDDPASAKPVTQEKSRGVRFFLFPYTNEHVLYRQDKGGDENWHLYAVDLKTGDIKDLTPYDGIAANVVGVSPKIPNEILIGINDRDKRYHDLYRVNVRTGERKLVRQNDGFAGFVADDDFKARLAMRMTPDGGQEYLDITGKAPRPFVAFGPEDSATSGAIGFDTAGTTLYFQDSRGRDTSALVALDPRTAKPSLLAEDPKADVDDAITHPRTGKVQAITSAYERQRWQVLDKGLQPDLDALRAVAEGDLEILSRSLDDRRWTVAYVVSDGPVRYYLYDRDKKQAKFLFTNQKALESLPLVKMHPVVIKARDGLELVSYLSLPRAADPDGDGKPERPLSMVLFVHGGPWARDTWGLNPMHQWLANRGYAVLSVNYRGSTGFGKRFINAGDREWAGKMHDDLLDAVGWSVAQGIADKDRVAIMGGSYGGYATLVGLTFTPEAFACGVDIVGPSNLVTLLESIPPYWAPMLELFAQRVGDPRTEDGKELLRSRSPLTRVEHIKRPLLIGQGANDPRVKQAESDQIVKAMQSKGIPVTYVLYPDEGHGFNRPENRTSFNAIAEIFLAQCLDGSYEPIGDDVKGSSLTVPAGADAVHGLAATLSQR
ncbi:peptidase S9 [Sorangium cellulosum]|uniref:Peptidase S9 n=1 Tax=Sorangium cellulosum TaxID=56 RepID=A0A4P2Q7W5_SORCE|nr:S9 family peptidase [Sorangium cellulosum]AUX25238.1 peptidase S9 [Sorangium cellulosum]